ncbi:MAG: hypothetical protein MIO93_05740 [ANME-2 cluster archaeon]|nr:hypothetical protein [ANME-2 cluster archaeon]
MKLSTPVTTSPTYPDRALISNSDDARNPPSEPYRDLPVDAGCSLTGRGYFS